MDGGREGWGRGRGEVEGGRDHQLGRENAFTASLNIFSCKKERRREKKKRKDIRYNSVCLWLIFLFAFVLLYSIYLFSLLVYYYY